MIAYHGGIQADVSEERLPADAVPAIGAYSLNRRLRKLYSGNFFQFRQGSEIKEYPAQQIDSNQDAFLVKVYDQKARHGVPTSDAVQNDTALQPILSEVTAQVQDPSFELPSGPNNGHHRDFNYVGTNLPRPNVIALKSNSGKKITKGNIYEVSLVRFQSGGFICRIRVDDGSSRFIGNRGVEYETVTEKTQITATFDQSEYLEISGLAEHVGTNFTITARGDGGDLPRPMFGLWGATEKTVNTEDSSIQLPTEPNNGNDYVFPAGERPLVMSLKTDSSKRIVAGDIYRLRRFRISNNNGQIENLDGTDPRYIGVRGAGWQTVLQTKEIITDFNQVTLEPSDLATRFTYNNNLGTIAEVDGTSIQCFSGIDDAQNRKRVISVNGKESGFVEQSTTSSDFENASIGKSVNRLFKGSFSELTIHSGDLTKLGAEQLFTTMKEHYGN